MMEAWKELYIKNKLELEISAGWPTAMACSFLPAFFSLKKNKKHTHKKSQPLETQNKNMNSNSNQKNINSSRPAGPVVF